MNTHPAGNRLQRTRAALLLLVVLGGALVAVQSRPVPVALAVTNPAIGNPPYTANPALPYKNSDKTVWTTNQVQIALAKTAGGSTTSGQFIAKGMNYEPTQIGGCACYPPFNDFFYDTGAQTYNGIWTRDLPTLRALGVNSIRTYGWWKWEPAGVNGTASTNQWPSLDFYRKLDVRSRSEATAYAIRHGLTDLPASYDP